jgi:hypothetical protein
MEAEQLVSFHLLALHYPLAPYGRVRLVSREVCQLLKRRRR